MLCDQPDRLKITTIVRGGGPTVVSQHPNPKPPLRTIIKKRRHRRGQAKKRRPERPRLMFGGGAWPKGVAYIVNGRAVTYEQVKARRKEAQAAHLARKLAVGGPVRQAALAWTFYVPGNFYSGWHLYVRTYRHSWWIKECDGIALEIMALYPCGFFPTKENFYDWKKAFAQTYAISQKRRRRHPEGVALGWIECRYDGAHPRCFVPASKVALPATPSPSEKPGSGARLAQLPAVNRGFAR